MYLLTKRRVHNCTEGCKSLIACPRFERVINCPFIHIKGFSCAFDVGWCLEWSALVASTTYKRKVRLQSCMLVLAKNDVGWGRNERNLQYETQNIWDSMSDLWTKFWNSLNLQLGNTILSFRKSLWQFSHLRHIYVPLRATKTDFSNR